MQQIIIETAIQSFVQELIKESSPWLSKASDEIKQFYNQGLRNYFTKQKDLYSHVKTVLQGNTPVYLYDIYFPINILKNFKEVKTNKISNLFVDTNFITIIGSAGSGKSMLIKHLFLNSIIENYGIPILIELRYLNDYDGDIEEYANELIFNNRVSQNASILQRLLRKGKFVFFLDGFDELVGDVREIVTKHISTFIGKYESNKFILTSRPYASVEYLPLFHNCHILPLKNLEISEFIDLQLKGEKELAHKIINTIETSPQKYIASFLSNPLLLSLFILTFQSNSDIPDKKYIFYRRVIQALFSEHDSKSKLGFVRERTSGLSQEQFETVLKRFSFLTFFDKKYDFELDYILSVFDQIKSKYRSTQFDSQALINDLKLAVALWIEDGNKVKFAHKSLQEYFAAVFIKDLNEDQKRTIYLKVADSLATMTEVDNFLSLCEEMDQVAYFKYFLIPGVQKAVDNLISENEDDLVNKLVKQSYSNLGFSDQTLQPYHYAGQTFPLRKVREISSTHRELDKYLADKMKLIFTSVHSADLVWSWGAYEQFYDEYNNAIVEQVYFLSLDPVPMSLTSYLKETGILVKISETKQNLLRLKKEKEEFVRLSEKANDELIEMI